MVACQIGTSAAKAICPVARLGGVLICSWRTSLHVIAIVFAAIVTEVALAAADRYDYDASGKLIRRVDPQGLGTDYLYDAAGNIVQVTAPGQALPPSITSGPLSDMRRNELKPVSITGSGLGGLTVRSSHSGIVITQLVQSSTTIGFRLAVSGDVSLGLQAVLLVGNAGTITLPFNVLPAYSYSVEPFPITVGTDNIARRFSLVAGEVATVTRTFALSVSANSIARPTVGSVSISAGQTRVDFGVLGLTSGATTLRFANADLFEPIEVTVSVFQGGGTPTSFSRTLQIARGQPFAWPGLQGNYSSPVLISRGTPPWGQSAQFPFSTSIFVQRWVPWATPASGGLVVSGTLQLQRQ